MKTRLIVCNASLLILIVMSIAGSFPESGANPSIPDELSVSAAASKFLTTLTEEQKKKALSSYDDAARFQWHFIPKDFRKGLQLKEMNDDQRKAADALLRSSLSLAGFSKAKKIMELESLLAAIEKGRGAIRDSQRYYFTLFGKPSKKNRWGLSIEGHHLSLNFVIESNQLIAVTPSFFAANPAVVKSDALPSVPRGTRVLADEEVLGFQLVNALNEKQKSKAIFSKKAPREIRAAGEAQPPSEKPIGIRGKAMNPAQMSLLKKLVGAYAANFPKQIRQKKLDTIQSDGWDNLYFAWGGATQPGIGHYYRVEGDNVLIEFVNTQPDANGNPANHIHCVWRNPKGDFAIELKK